MFRKIISILLITALLAGVIGVIPGWAAGADMTTSRDAVNLLKDFEQFSKYPFYDFSQYSVGYGTRCPDEDYERYARDGITEAEAETLLRDYLKKTETALNNFARNQGLSWSQNQFDALVLFSYNCGTTWLYQSGEFRNAVISGKTGNDLIYPIALWCSAGGTILDSLINRRLCEANLYINGIYSKVRPENYCFVKYNAQGGVSETRIEGYDANLGLSPRPKATYSNKVFAGWYTEKTGGTRVTVLNQAVNGKTLYAHWQNPGEEIIPTPSTPADPNFRPVTVTVTAELLNVRSGAGTGNPVVATLRYGTEVAIVSMKESGGQKWGQISEGWICLAYTTYDAEMAGLGEDTIVGKVVGEVVDTNNLRIRSGPGLSYSVVGYLHGGTKVEITLRQKADGMVWGRISQGWISMDYVKLEEEEAEIPAPETPTPPSAQNGQIGWVFNSSYLNVRSGPGFAYGIIGKLYTGDQVRITEIQEADGMKWGKIDSGWVSMDYIRLETQEAPPAAEEPEEKEPLSGVVYNCENLRIRSGPGTDYAIVGYLSVGTEVSVTETKENGGMEWGKIAKGWISMDYVKLGDQEPEAPPELTLPNPPETPEEPSGKTQMGTVYDAGYLNVRSGPGLSYPSVGGKTTGDRVEILETVSADGMDWGRITEGWISMNYVKLDPTWESRTMTVTADYLNVRSGPGFDFAVVNGLDEGTRITVYEEAHADGLTWGKTDLGWVCMDYVK